MARRAVVVLAGLAIGLSGLSVPAVAETPRSPADCAASLDCTAEDINLLSMPQRLELVRTMSAGPAESLSAADRWRNLEGVLAFFADHRLGAPGSWVSYVDAGIVEGIERGIAIALGRASDGFGNPGSARWARYLTRLSTGELGNRAAHDLLAGYGPLIHPELAGLRVPFYDWFTDVSRSAPSYKGCEMAYGFAQLHSIDGVLGPGGLFLASVAELFHKFLAEQDAD